MSLFFFYSPILFDSSVCFVMGYYYDFIIVIIVIIIISVLTAFLSISTSSSSSSFRYSSIRIYFIYIIFYFNFYILSFRHNNSFVLTHLGKSRFVCVRACCILAKAVRIFSFLFLHFVHSINKISNEERERERNNNKKKNYERISFTK